MCNRELWGLQLEDEWVWELDSSSPDKWSRHIIVVVPGRAFPNNLALGAFVNQLLSLPQVGALLSSCLVQLSAISLSKSVWWPTVHVGFPPCFSRRHVSSQHCHHEFPILSSTAV